MVVEPRLGFLVDFVCVTQGALRDPGLWNTTALRLMFVVMSRRHRKAGAHC